MALTFRDFMLGLADAAPKISELLVNYSQFAQQQQNVNRQLANDEKRTEAYVGAMDAQTKDALMSVEEKKLLIPLKIKTEELQQAYQQNLIDDNKALREAQASYTNPKTGRKGYSGFVLDEMLGKMDLQNAQIAQALAGATSEAARAELYGEQKKLQQIEFGMNVFNTFGELATDEKTMGKLNKHWESSKGNIETFIDYVRTDNEIKMMNPRVAKMLPNILSTINELDKEKYVSTLKRADYYEMKFNENSNEAMKSLGVKSPLEFWDRLGKMRERPQFDWAGLTGSTSNQLDAVKTSNLTFEGLYNASKGGKSKTQYDIDPMESPAAGILGTGVKTLTTPGKYESQF